MFRSQFFASVSLASIALATPAFAQDVSSEPAEAEPEAGLEVIVVTAQRREEAAQNAAIPIDVVKGSDLTEAGVNDVTTLGNLTPALTVEPTSTGNLLFVRGVGNFTLVPTSDPAIAFNYDGVYIGRPTSTSGAFFDLDRVEVLKGPQGTLYGRNATGGAINVIPTRPKLGETSGYVSASYGNYDHFLTEGAINLAMGDNGALRVSGSVQDRDGYYRDGTADEVSQALRVQMMAELTPSLTVRVAGDYFHQGGAGPSVTYVGRYQFAGPAGYVFVPSGLPDSEGLYTDDAQAFRQTAFAGPAGRNVDALSPFPFRDNDFYGVNAEVTLDTGVGTLTVIPAFRVSELDYLATAGAFIARTVETDEQFSFEVRFAGDRIGMFDYTLGALYFDEDIDVTNGIFVSALASIADSRLGTESFAPFGRITAHLTDELRVVGGIRYTRDSKTYQSAGSSGTIVCQIVTPMGPSCPTAPLFPYVESLADLPFPFPAAGQIPPVVPVGGGAIAIRSERNQDNSLVNKKVTWRGAVEYDVAPSSLLYASVETGFRSGGFSSAAGFETYDPEFITAYTIGSKNRLLDNRLQLNVEAFYWKYRDQQVNFVGLDLAGRTANQTRNIGSSDIKGIEVDTAFLITPTTLIGANVQYLDAENKSFVYSTGNTVPPTLSGCPVLPNADPALVDVDCSSFPAYNSPKWTLNLSGQQTIELGDYDLVLSADTQFKTGRYIAFQYLPEQYLDSTWRTNAQISFGPAEGSWSIAGFVRNIENNRTPTFQTLAPITNFLVASTAAPRTYGIRATMNF